MMFSAVVQHAVGSDELDFLLLGLGQELTRQLVLIHIRRHGTHCFA